MKPIQFGNADSLLRGIHHEPSAAPSGAAVLWCPPFGQEAVRTHRISRIVSDRLARAGHHVLRFDYYGTGDSAGDDEDGNPDRWVDDIGVAHQILMQRSGARKALWVGVRLGAAVAARAAAALERPLSGLVFWEPVLSGPAYLAELERAHLRALDPIFITVPVGLRGARVDQVIGFGTSAAWRAGVAGIAPSSYLGMRAAGISWIDTPLQLAVSDGNPWRGAYDGDVRAVALPSQFDWNAEEARDGALVPAPAVKTLVDEIGRWV